MTTDPPPVRQALTLLGLLAAATVAGAAVGAALHAAAGAAWGPVVYDLFAGLPRGAGEHAAWAAGYGLLVGAELGGAAGLAALILASIPHGPRARGRDVGAVFGVATLAVVAATVGAGCGLAYGWFRPRSVHLVFPVENAPGYGGREARAALAAVRAGLSFAFWATAGGAALAGLWLRVVWAGRAAIGRGGTDD